MYFFFLNIHHYLRDICLITQSFSPREFNINKYFKKPIYCTSTFGTEEMAKKKSVQNMRVNTIIFCPFSVLFWVFLN